MNKLNFVTLMGLRFIAFILCCLFFNTAHILAQTPAAITGTTSVCVGATTTLNDATSGGTWSSSNTATGTVNSVTGVVAGIAAGTTTISYIVTGGSAIVVVTVAPIPLPVNIYTIAGNSGRGFSGDGAAATNATLFYPTGVAVDGSSNVYIADYSNHRIRKVSTSGIITTIAGNGTGGFGGDGVVATTTGLNFPSSVAVDGSGNVYIADQSNNRIRKVSTSGIITTIAGNGTSGYSGDGGAATASKLSGPSGVVVDISGNVFIADQSNNRIRKVSTSGFISTVAGNGTSGYSGDGGAATASNLSGPSGVAVDGSGNLYIADQSNNRIRKVSTSGIITTVAGNGTSGYGFDGGVATSATVNSPSGVAVDGSGNVYITDQNYSRIRYVSTSGVISTIAGIGSTGYSGDGGVATAAMLYYPTGGGVDGNGNVYIADQLNMVVRIIRIVGSIGGIPNVCTGATTTLSNVTPGGTWSSSNTSVATIGSTGVLSGVAAGTTIISYIVAGMCGSPAASVLVTVNTPPASITGTSTVCAGSSITLSDATPGGIWNSSSTGTATIGSTGVVSGVSAGIAAISYMVGPGCGSGYTVTVNANPSPGFISSMAGSLTYGYSGDGGPATAAQLARPQAIASDGSGNVYIADSRSNRVRKVTSSGIISTIAGNGIAGYAGNGGAATAAQLDFPVGLAIDGSGNVYIAEQGNQVIRKVNTSGIISTFAGSTPGYSGDGGLANTAQLNNPTGVAVDRGGNVYIADGSNGRIRKVNTSGIISTIAGGSGGSIGDGGAATLANINYSTGVAIDSSGNVYISANNNRIRKVNTSGIISTVAGNGTAGYSGDGGAATAAVLNYPNGLAVDGSGNIYISDQSNNRIRVIHSSGIINTVAGNGAQGYTGDGGAATATSLYSPSGVAIDVSGDILIADTYNNLIRKIYGPLAIGGNTNICRSSTTPLYVSIPGGTWSSSNTAVATIGSTGLASGVAAGTAVISYVLSNVCYSGVTTAVVTVYPQPVPVSGATSVCTTSNTTLSDATAGGVWSSSNTGVATIGSTGIVAGVSAGTTTISYTIGAACSVGYTLTVSQTPASITGSTYVCSGSATTLSDATSGGTWSSSNTAVATIGTTGIVSGVSAGTVTISYVIDSRCVVGYTLTVIAQTASITGAAYACLGSDITLSDATPGGTWSSSNSSIATVGSTGTVHGVAAGYVIITYVTGGACGVVSREILINAYPIISTIAGNGTQGNSGDGGAATNAQLSYPEGVASDSSGNLYIADYANGRIRKINTSGIISTFYATFGYTTAVATDRSGNVYFADRLAAKIFKMNASGIISTIAGNGTNGFSGDGGPATAAKLRDPSGLAIDGNGNIYFSDYTNDRIRKVSTSGIISTIAGNGGRGYGGDGGAASAAPLWGPIGVAVDSSGNVYIADNSNHRVRKVNSSGIISTIAGNGSNGFSGDGAAATGAQLYYPDGVAIDRIGNIYITDNSNHRIRKVTTSGIISTYTGRGTAGYSGDGGAATGAELKQPTGVYIDASNNLYITDDGNNTVRKVSLGRGLAPIMGLTSICQGGFRGSTILSNSTSGGIWSSSNTSVATIGSTGLVTGVALGTTIISYVLIMCDTLVQTTIVTVNPTPSSIIGANSICVGSAITLTDATSGGIWISSNTVTAIIGSSTGVVNGVTAGAVTISYVLATGCGVGYIVNVNASISPGYISSLAGNGTAGYSGDGGAANAAQLYSPTGIAFDSSGNMYVAEYSNHRIRKVTTSGIISTIAGNGIQGYSGDGGAATAGELNNPSGVAIDGSGNVYIADLNNQRIRKVNVSGIISTFAGDGTGGFYGDGGSATSAKLQAPYGVAVDGSGNLLIADAYNNRIRKVTSSGIISTLAGNGTGGYSGDGGAATTGALNYPTGVAIDSSGNVYIADFNNHRIRKVNVSGFISTVAGNGTSGYFGDGGDPFYAKLNYPFGVATDRRGNIYISDRSNNRIRVINSGGIITTVAGNGSTGYTGDGAATATGLNSPGGLAIDVSGNILIADAGNNLVRKLYSNNQITGVFNVCLGTTTTLSISTTGGTWISSNTAIATIGSTGVVSGVAAGTAIISYVLSYVCNPAPATAVVTIFPQPVPVTGASSVCTASNTTLNDATSGGVWSSSNTAVATIGSTGIVGGLSAGTTTISYIIGATCGVAYTLTVNPTPASIAGAGSVCTGSNITLTNSTSGGSWSSSNSAMATIGSSSGTVNGIAMGTTVITYALPAGCNATLPLTINTIPVIAPITGTNHLCVGNTVTLSNVTPGGFWFSSDNSIASITMSGVVTGVATGTRAIGYVVYNGCGANQVFTPIYVSGTIPALGGSSSVCAGDSTTLTDSVSGGNWTSSNTAVATIGSGSGIMTGVSSGTTIITYATYPGCFNSAVITVNSLPDAGAISGSASVCSGSSVVMSESVPGGAWSSSNSNASVVSGTVSGVTVGTSVISYAITNTCGTSYATWVISVSPLAVAGTISGPDTVYVSATATLTAYGAGSWTSGNTGIATVGLSTGIVTGVSVGNVVITYSVTNGCGTSYSIHSMTVNSYGVSPISGSTSVCVGTGTTLTDATTGGNWVSSNTAVATIGSASGILNGLTIGTTIITYSAVGGFVTTIISVSAVPSVIGPTSVCAGDSTTLTNSVSGGTWTSTNTAVAAIGSGSGILTGVSSGTSTISYSTSSGCSGVTVITVNPLPDAGSISGASSVCTGVSTTLTETALGGVWSSTSTSVATIGSTGSVLGVTAGTTIISYTVTNSCGSAVATKTMLLNPTPDAGSISGASAVCVGANITLTDAASGGVWSASNANATVSGGVVTGVSAGIDTIIYSVTTACGTATATKTISVNPLPVAGSVSGPSSVCASATITLSDGVSGGSWTSGAPSKATVNTSTGIVTGVSAGTATISYGVTNSCGTAYATYIITINPAPNAGTISGPSTVGLGATITLADAIPGGTWGNTTGNASVSGGLVTGLFLGRDTITYTVTNICGTAVATKNILVDTTVASITGITTICMGSTTTLIDTGSGIWTSGNPSIATVGATTGVVTGIAAGIANITYTSSGGFISITVTVNPTPLPIGGTTIMCVGNSTVLLEPTTGATWSSANTSIAAVGTTGMVTGVSAGTTIISYINSFACYRTTIVTINPIPAAIGGPSSVCAGMVITLTNTVSSGSWSSSSPSIASIGSATGVVNGIAGGLSANISYTIANGCIATKMVTVNSLSAIAGPGSVCQGQFITLTNSVAGGIWTTSDATVSVVGSTGAVTGISAGTATVSYVLGTGCTAASNVTINASSSISGPTSVCQGQTITLTNANPGGVWSSSAPLLASIGNASGIVSGFVAGYVNISYTLGTGCAVGYVVSVNPLAAIGGSTNVCQSQTIILTNSIAGGLWSSATGTITVGSVSGVITGVSAGTALVSYTLVSGCNSTYVITVNPSAAIAGPGIVCNGQSITLTNANPGGVWTSAAPTIATIGSSSGILTGIAGGYSATINYTLGTGCAVSKVVTVNPLAAISGLVNVCPALTINLTNPVPGGTWSSSAAGIATVGSNTGIVSGITGGTVTISYLLPTGCLSTTTITVGALTPIVGPGLVCVTQPITLIDVTPGGTWQSSAPTIATVGSTGIVTGVAANLTANITYSISSTCRAIKTVTVNALTANSISGTVPICMGQSNPTATNPTAGGTWSTSNISIVTIGTTGLITGVSSGSAVISYSLSSGCVAMSTVTVNALLPIVGPSSVCQGKQITLTNATSGGTWASGGTSATIASITSGGVVTGLAANLNAILTYTLGSGCKANFTVSVLANPAAPAAIVGASSVSVSGSTIILTDATAGGTWSSSNIAKATVGAGTGIVSGVGVGSATITYTVTNAGGCTAIATKVISVGPANPNDPGNSLSLDHTQLPGGSIVLIPNPNEGEFTIKGNLEVITDSEVEIEVLDMLGQVVYKGSTGAISGRINERVKLSNTLANGMYLMNIRTTNEQHVLHFVVER